MKRNNIFVIWFMYILVFVAYLGVTYFYNVPKGTEVFSYLDIFKNIDTIITLTMFLIVFVIFANATIKFGESNKLCNSLKKVADDIENGTIQSINNIFFDNDLLQTQYSKYIDELNRLSKNGSYQCDITDYINKDFIDSKTGKSILNTIPSVMTGLGILGTFIGLYLGLQGFKTGSAGEITESITPLMNGIKVAFVTSIIGMIFSLVFNYIYKKSYELTYKELDRFVSLHDRYVMNNSVYENESKMLVLLDKSPTRIRDELDDLVKAYLSNNESHLSKFYKMSEENNVNLSETKSIVSGIAESLGASLANMLEPQFEKMNITLDALAKNISTHTVAAIDESAKQFVNSMNESLGNNFVKLGNVIEETTKLQKANNDMVKEVMDNLEHTVENVMEKIDKISNNVMNNILEVDEYTKETANAMASFSKDLEQYQRTSAEYIDILNNHFEEHSDMENNLKSYVEAMIAQQQSMEEASKTMIEELNKKLLEMEEFKKALIDTTQININNITAITSEHIQQIANLANQQMSNITGVSAETAASLNEAAEKLGKTTNKLSDKLDHSIVETFKTFDRELSIIAKHLSGTILEIRDITDRIPKTLSNAMEGVEHSFAGIQNSFDDMKKSLEKIEITKE